MNLEKEVFELAIDDIMPNRFQPREVFDDESINELAQSIKEHGVIQPIIVRKIGDKYEIVAGERRFRASKVAGKTTIPALVRNVDDKESAKIALLENLQRKNLTAIEEAKTYQTILKLDNLTQDELANTLGKSQSTIANKLRLLNLADEVQKALLNEQISERHARSLLNIEDKEQQKQLLEKVILNRMTVKQLDDEIATITGKTVSLTDEEEQQPIINNEVSNEIPPVAPSNVFESLRNESTNKIQQEPQIKDDMFAEVFKSSEIPEYNEEGVSIEQPVTNVTEPIINQEEEKQPVIPTFDTIQQNSILPEQSINENPIKMENSPIQPEFPTLNTIDPNSIPPMQQFNDIPAQQSNVEIPIVEEIPRIPTLDTMEPVNVPLEQSINEFPVEINTNNTIMETPMEQNLNSSIENNPAEGVNINFFSNIDQLINKENASISYVEPTEPTVNLNSEPVISPLATQEENKPNDIYDLRFAINNFRQAVQNTEKFGFIIDTEEFDFDNVYQFIIKINKNK